MNTDKKLQEQLSRLGEQIGSQPSIVDAVMQRVEQEAVAPVPRIYRLRRILMKTTMSLAASILIAVAVWFAISQSAGTPAYGLADLAQRLAHVKSLHVKGYCMRPSASGELVKCPIEMYVDRPTKYWGTFYGPDALVPGYRMSDGDRYMNVDPEEKTCTTGKEIRLAAESSVESRMELLFSEPFGGSLAGFKKIGTEQVKGIAADVYEKVERPDGSGRPVFRYVVYLNPATGLPLRIVGYAKASDNPETIRSEFTDIEPNMPVPSHLFSFKAPDGYKVINKDRLADDIGHVGFGQAGAAHQCVRFAFDIGNQAILACWAMYNEDKGQVVEDDLDGPAGRQLKTTPASTAPGRTYGNYLVRVDPAGKYHWRWSLVIPQGKDTKLDGDEPRQTVYDGRSSTTTTIQPRHMTRERLADIVVRAQEVTLPADTPAEAVFTLERLEEMVRQIRKQGPEGGR